MYYFLLSFSMCIIIGTSCLWHCNLHKQKRSSNNFIYGLILWFHVNGFFTIDMKVTFISTDKFQFQVTHCASSLAPPADGNVTCTHDREVGSDCTFSCSTDYQLYGTTTRTCIESGNFAYWNGTETVCTGIAKLNFYIVFIGLGYIKCRMARR